MNFSTAALVSRFGVHVYDEAAQIYNEDDSLEKLEALHLVDLFQAVAPFEQRFKEWQADSSPFQVRRCLEAMHLADLHSLRERMTAAAKYRAQLRDAADQIGDQYKKPAEGLAACQKAIAAYKEQKAKFCEDLPVLKELFPDAPEVDDKIDPAAAKISLETIKLPWPHPALRKRIRKDAQGTWMLDEKDIKKEKAMTAVALQILGTWQTRFRLEIVAETIKLEKQ